ncbi:Uma2 family endonuclease [Kitasatospora sp. NPDC008115]|uniref:Uma2 family endonuclease n=1 Tax=Kitasatospora sp. NPDC008115 TaxID=3364022 RepID=UPI0036F17490
MPQLPVRPGALREAASELGRLTGLGVEVIGGTLVLAPPRRGKHVGTVQRLREQLDAGLPERLTTCQVVSVGMPGDGDDYATPDLTVLPRSWEEGDDWLVDPRDVALAVEVVPRSEGAWEVTVKSDWYAAAEVPALLALDPRWGRWVLHTGPRKGGYGEVLRGVYGEPVPLAVPLPRELRTDRLPRWAAGERALTPRRRRPS